MTKWSDLSKVDSRLVTLREERFAAGKGALQPLLEQVFEPLEYLSGRDFGGVMVDLSPFTVAWAWGNYWNAMNQDEVDKVILSWVPTLMLANLLRGLK